MRAYQLACHDAPSVLSPAGASPNSRATGISLSRASMIRASSEMSLNPVAFDPIRSKLSSTPRKTLCTSDFIWLTVLTFESQVAR